MKKANTQNRMPVLRTVGNLAETANTIRKELVDAVNFDLLVPSEILGVKSTLRDLQRGDVQFFEHEDAEGFAKLWLYYLEKMADLAKGETEHIMACVPIPDSDEMPGSQPLETEVVVWGSKERPITGTTGSVGADNCWHVVMGKELRMLPQLAEKKVHKGILDAIEQIINRPLDWIPDVREPLGASDHALWQYQINHHRLIYWPDIRAKRIFLLAYRQ